MGAGRRSAARFRRRRRRVQERVAGDQPHGDRNGSRGACLSRTALHAGRAIREESLGSDGDAVSPQSHGDGLGVECGAAICPDRTGDRHPHFLHPSGQHGLHPGCAEQSAGKVRVAQPRGSGTEGLRAGPECGAGGSGCPPARFRCGAWRGL